MIKINDAAAEVLIDELINKVEDLESELEKKFNYSLCLEGWLLRNISKDDIHRFLVESKGAFDIREGFYLAEESNLDLREMWGETK